MSKPATGDVKVSKDTLRELAESHPDPDVRDACRVVLEHRYGEVLSP